VNMVAEKQAKKCSHCATSDTPLWRMGPQGAKSLCNACGLRWRKTGRMTDDMPSNSQVAGVGSGAVVSNKRISTASSGIKKKSQKKSEFNPKKKLVHVEHVDVERYPVAEMWPPAVEAFRKSATKKTERLYTLDDFWPYYNNVFSGLMVVHKSTR